LGESIGAAIQRRVTAVGQPHAEQWSATTHQDSGCTRVNLDTNISPAESSGLRFMNCEDRGPFCGLGWHRDASLSRSYTDRATRTILKIPQKSTPNIRTTTLRDFWVSPYLLISTKRGLRWHLRSTENSCLDYMFGGQARFVCWLSCRDTV
jgi:hypothetical protein